jgi:DNA-binding MarR family transcriptional regulator
MSTGSLLKMDVLESLELEMGYLIRRVKRVICERAQEIHPDLQAGSYSILAMLNDGGPQRATAVAEVFGMDKGAVSRHIQHLVELGLADRAPDPDDGRAQIVRVTEKGAERMAAVARSRRRLLSDRLAGWSEDDLESFVSALGRYNETLGRPAAAGDR